MNDVLQKPIFEGLPEARGQGYEELLQKVFTTGKTFRANESPALLPRDDRMETVYVNYVYDAIKEIDGTISGIISVANEVTEQVLARRKIQEAEEKTRLAINSADLGVYEVLLNNNTVTTDARFNQIWGFSETRPRNDYTAIIHPDDQPIRARAHQESLVTGHLHYDARIIRHDQSVRWVRVQGKVLFDETGTATKLLGVVQDITEQKQFAEALEKKVMERTRALAAANQQLHQSNVELNEFVYIASHDLQEPLRKIRTFTGLIDLSLKTNPGEIKNYIGKIQSSSERMQALINDVLDFSLLSKDREKFQKTDLNIILKHVMDDFALMIQQKGAKITCGALPAVEAIPVQMNQLFANLLSNALKFCSEERPVEISIHSKVLSKQEVLQQQELKEDKTHHILEFRDNGIGFYQKYANQIFSIFKRLHGNREYDGTGIGLAMCKKIALNHHGIIYADSMPGEGSSFFIVLPEAQDKEDLLAAMEADDL
jgi:PAS domain S-box-containing protein